jgi:hypothetical protein
MHCNSAKRQPDGRSSVRPHTFRSLLIPILAFLAIAAWPEPAAAQRRVRRSVVRPVIVRGVYGPMFFSPWAFGYGYPYPPYGYVRYDDLTASVRLEVTPNTAEVYVDGFRAGTVDGFDGIFQRLRLRPGEHELVLYLDGYRTVHENLYVNARADLKIRYTMVPLAAGEQAEPRPEPQMSPEEGEIAPGMPSRPGTAEPGRGRPRPGGPARPLPGPPNTRYGSVSIRVQPADADVLIDGEPWSASSGQDRLVVELAAGRHHLEIRKEGFEPYANDIDVRAGETVPLNVSLLRK